MPRSAAFPLPLTEYHQNIELRDQCLRDGDAGSAALHDDAAMQKEIEASRLNPQPPSGSQLSPLSQEWVERNQHYFQTRTLRMALTRTFGQTAVMHLPSIRLVVCR